MTLQLLAHLLVVIPAGTSAIPGVESAGVNFAPAQQAAREGHASHELRVDLFTTFRDVEVRHSAIVSTPTTYNAWATSTEGLVLCLDNKGNWAALSVRTSDGRNWARGAVDVFVPSPDGNRVLLAESGGRLAIITVEDGAFNAMSFWNRRAAIRVGDPGFADGVELHYALWQHDGSKVVLAYEDGQILQLDCESMVVTKTLAESKWIRSDVESQAVVLFPLVLNRLASTNDSVTLMVRERCMSARPLALVDGHLVVVNTGNGIIQSGDGVRVSVVSDSSQNVTGSENLIIISELQRKVTSLSLLEISRMSIREANVWSQSSDARLISGLTLQQAVKSGPVIVALMKDGSGQYFRADLSLARRGSRFRIVPLDRVRPGGIIGLRVDRSGSTGIGRLLFPEFSVSVIK